MLKSPGIRELGRKEEVHTSHWLQYKLKGNIESISDFVCVAGFLFFFFTLDWDLSALQAPVYSAQVNIAISVL